MFACIHYMPSRRFGKRRLVPKIRVVRCITMDGVMRCARYAFGPNRLHYCGPDKAGEMKGQLDDGKADRGVREMLQAFETLYPYLTHIARANRIADPLDARVVEAYWVGNALLENVSKNDLYWHLVDNLAMKKRFGSGFRSVEGKIAKGALPHHSFHVLDVWKRMEEATLPAAIESMSECRVSSGVVTSVSGPFVTVKTERIEYRDGALMFSRPYERRLVRHLESEYDIERLKPGDTVAIHWGVIAEILSKRQARDLRRYTLRHLALANDELAGK